MFGALTSILSAPIKVADALLSPVADLVDEAVTTIEEATR